jgi:tetratricopeptide (TPR) repeat protein
MNLLQPLARSRGRATLNIAVWLLALIIVAQIGAIGWALLRKRSVPAAAAQVPTPAVTPPADSVPAASVPAAAPHSAPAAPSLAEDFGIADERVLFFLESALSNRDKGDMKAALPQLRAASDLMPQNPRLLYELATTYEKMALPDKATSVWDQIFKLGPGAGIYFRLAAAKFEMGDGRAPREVEVTLQLGKILERTEQNPNFAEQVTLRIPVQARDAATIDPGKVSVVTQFFDDVGGRIKETNALTDRWRWLSGESPTWTTNSVEFLEQSYQQPKTPVVGAGTPPRRYHGYTVKLYYNDHLQDVMAKPANLANLRPEPGERPLENFIDSPSLKPSGPIEDSLFPLPQ